MIPKPLSEIEWADIEALRDSGREEDDTIEFKASFSGGADYLEFNDAKRAKAIEGIAREAVAFLNGRGGDIVIGAREATNDHPKIEEITPLQNIDQTVDRLAQSLSALIEPSQTVLGLRAIRQVEGTSEGVIIVRCPSSLRAPHRFTPTKECYVRRGRSSIPMPMDEVQDLSVQRNSWRSQRLAEVESLFERFEEGAVRRETAQGDRFQMRMAYVPISKQQISLTDELIRRIFSQRPQACDRNGSVQIEDSFFRLGQWKPALRGRAQTNLEGNNDSDYRELIGRELRENGSIIFDVSWRYSFIPPGRSAVRQVVPATWIIDFIVNCLWSIRQMTILLPTSMPGHLVVKTHVVGLIELGLDSSGKDLMSLLPLRTDIQPFEINELSDLDDALNQLQIDLFALVERAPRYVLSFEPVS